MVFHNAKIQTQQELRVVDADRKRRFGVRRGSSPAASPALVDWARQYLLRQSGLCTQLPLTELAALIDLFQDVHRCGAQIFVFGNGGSAANASHLATDLGKGASDAMSTPFRVISLNDNTAWRTAIGNDYAYEDAAFIHHLHHELRRS